MGVILKKKKTFWVELWYASVLDFISLSLVCVFVSQKKKNTNIKDRSIFPQILSRIFNYKSDGEKGSPNNWFQKKRKKRRQIKRKSFFF